MVHNHNHKIGDSKTKLFWAILFNSIITLAEFIGGFMSGYLSLMADAAHNLSDVAALGLALVGVKGAQMPATKRSTFGFKRVEVMTAFISAASLIVIAIFILIEAFERFESPQTISHPAIFLSVAVIGLIGNLLSIWLLHSEKGKSLNMKTAFLHMAYDALSSVAVIAGGVVIALTDWVIVDTILSTLISLMIFWSSYLVIKEAFLIFLEAVPGNIDFDEVARSIRNMEYVMDVHDLHIWSLSSQEVALSVHVSIAQEHLAESDRMISLINQKIQKEFGIGHGTIQIETSSCGTPNLLCNPAEQGANGLRE